MPRINQSHGHTFPAGETCLSIDHVWIKKKSGTPCPLCASLTRISELEKKNSGLQNKIWHAEKDSNIWFAKSERLEAENAALKLGSLSPLDYKRLVKWMKESKRKPAIIAFTAGACRDAARAFEEAGE